MNYSIWIEAEQWVPGEWNPADDNSDVIVSFDDGACWVATFFSYRNIQSLTEKYKTSGECLNGKYFWATDMILLDEVSRLRIEEIVKHLMNEGEFEHVFSRSNLTNASADNS